MKEYLRRLFHGETLDQASARQALALLLDGKHGPVIVGAFLGAIQSRRVTAAELSGFVLAMFDRAINIPSHDPQAIPSNMIDVCGSGGDEAGTFNISTTAGLVLAGGGAQVAKHGNRSVSSKCGSYDVLEALGIATELNPTAFIDSIKAAGFGFLAAPIFHPGLAVMAPLRRELGVRTVFNLMAPIANPARTKRQVIGIYDRNLMETIARAHRDLGGSHTLVVRGECGLDELSLSHPTRIVEQRDGTIRDYLLSPEDVGIPRASRESLRGGDSHENAVLIEAILQGKRGPTRDVVLLNAGAGFYVSGLAPTLRDGVALAAESIDSGRAHKVLQTLRALKAGRA